MAFQRAGAYIDRLTEPGVGCLCAIDWLNEARLIGTAVLIAIPILWLVVYLPNRYWYEFNSLCSKTSSTPPFKQLLESFSKLSSKFNALLPQTPSHAGGTRIFLCGGPRPRDRYESTRRTVISDTHVMIWGWPSRGGVIILADADSIDLEFLGLDIFSIPESRKTIQADEDAFCKQLLLLGAKWWDSEARFNFICKVEERMGSAIDDLDMEVEPYPTMREKRWVSVAWPSTGGLWVAEFDTSIHGVEEEEDNQVPEDTARLRLARTMDERSQILQDHFEPNFYNNVTDYKGYAFLHSWETKVTGEVGPLMVWQHGAFEAISPRIGPKTQFSMPVKKCEARCDQDIQNDSLRTC